MKGRTIALDHLGDVEAAALIVDGQLSDLLVDHDLPRPGTIYRGIAERPMKGQGGLFLRTPDGMAFVRQVKGISPGQALTVQVTGYAEPGKALPVTQKLLFKSRYAIITPGAPGLNVSRSIKDDAERDRLLEIAHDTMDSTGDGPGFGLILRSACEDMAEQDIAEDILAMRELAEQVLADAQGQEPAMLVEGDGPHVVAWRDWTAPAEVDTADGSFESHGVLDALEDLRGPAVTLAGGASFWVEPTRALVAVDVNTGGDTSPAAGLKVNMACARDLPRQLRLRGLGGQVVIDFAPMPKKDRRVVETTLRTAFKADVVDTTLIGWTPLGHFELHRKRDRVALAEVLK